MSIPPRWDSGSIAVTAAAAPVAAVAVFAGAVAVTVVITGIITAIIGAITAISGATASLVLSSSTDGRFLVSPIPGIDLADVRVDLWCDLNRPRRIEVVDRNIFFPEVARALYARTKLCST